MNVILPDQVAVRLRAETAVTVRWIAERLRMGSVANVNTMLYHLNPAPVG